MRNPSLPLRTLLPKQGSPLFPRARCPPTTRVIAWQQPLGWTPGPGSRPCLFCPCHSRPCSAWAPHQPLHPTRCKHFRPAPWRPHGASAQPRDQAMQSHIAVGSGPRTQVSSPARRTPTPTARRQEPRPSWGQALGGTGGLVPTPTQRGCPGQAGRMGGRSVPPQGPLRSTAGGGGGTHTALGPAAPHPPLRDHLLPSCQGKGHVPHEPLTPRLAHPQQGLQAGGSSCPGRGAARRLSWTPVPGPRLPHLFLPLTAPQLPALVPSASPCAIHQEVPATNHAHPGSQFLPRKGLEDLQGRGIPRQQPQPPTAQITPIGPPSWGLGTR